MTTKHARHVHRTTTTFQQSVFPVAQTRYALDVGHSSALNAKLATPFSTTTTTSANHVKSPVVPTATTPSMSVLYAYRTTTTPSIPPPRALLVSSAQFQQARAYSAHTMDVLGVLLNTF